MPGLALLQVLTYPNFGLEAKACGYPFAQAQVVHAQS